MEKEGHEFYLKKPKIEFDTNAEQGASSANCGTKLALCEIKTEPLDEYWPTPVFTIDAWNQLEKEHARSIQAPVVGSELQISTVPIITAEDKDLPYSKKEENVIETVGESVGNLLTAVKKKAEKEQTDQDKHIKGAKTLDANFNTNSSGKKDDNSQDTNGQNNGSNEENDKDQINTANKEISKVHPAGTNQENQPEIHGNVNGRRHQSSPLNHLSPTKKLRLEKPRRLYSDQSEISPIADALVKMRKDKIGTDCEIKIQGEIFHCHSVILRRHEGSFFREIFENSSMENECIFQTEEISKATFKKILQYLYTSKVDLSSYDEALQMLAASKELKLDELVKHCTRYCTRQLLGDEASIWQALEDLLHNQPQPYQLCLCGVASFNKLIFKKEFLSISYNTLRFIVEQNFLPNCKENILVHYVEEWAKHQLGKENIDVNHENLRGALGPIIGKLRFLCFREEDFLQLFRRTLLITEKEKLAILESFLSGSSNAPAENISSERKTRDGSHPNLFRIPKYPMSSDQLFVDPSSPSVRCSFVFSPNVDILLLSFQFFAKISTDIICNGGFYTERITAQVLRIDGSNAEILRELSISELVEYDSCLTVKLPAPVILHKSNVFCYAIKIILHSAGTYNTEQNNYNILQTFDQHNITPLKSDWCWGNDGIFTGFKYKVID
ncbi:uncharacterized protein LOC132205137 [Neocloeon triangulifer]|uniref:uncharacterized protein LOC132205137 n=1 Tax=Neocloeon triangulifer TaxID=2078957 RepID=UPI00286EDD8D|nr:uncharacterized protein LOC132205137 [Neocloeon triangulifer]XP_059490005.1 uncharacterized protein LOC132205137 [Neocloeon triangulifer]